MANTKQILIAERYSEALVEIAKEDKMTYSGIGKDLDKVKEILSMSKDLNDVLSNPVTSIDNKKEVIDRVFSKEINILILNFLKVLIDKNRFHVFEEIVKSYNKALDAVNNISRIEVVSAVEMSEESQNKLKNKLESKLKKNIILDLSVNSEILAGLIIKISDNIIDTSLKHKLEDLSKNIIK
jgi:F-type H+-transporting ATPase subunit delta